MSKSPATDVSVVEQIRREADQLLHARMRGEADACARIRRHAPRFAKSSDAAILASSSAIDTLETVSRERGFASWRAAQEAAEGHKLLPGDASLEHLKKQAKKLLKAYKGDAAAARERVRAHHQGDPFTLNDAQFVVAREYGYDSWPKLVGQFERSSDYPSINRPQLFAIEQMHEGFRRELGEIFTRHLGETAICDTAFVDQTTHPEFVMSLSRPSCLCHFAIDAMRNRAALDIAMKLTMPLLGKDKWEGEMPDEERWLNDEEKGRMGPVFGEVLAALQRAWEPVLPTVFGDVQLETDPNDIMQMITVERYEPVVILIAFRVSTLDNWGFVSISYPMDGGIYELREHLA